MMYGRREMKSDEASRETMLTRKSLHSLQAYFMSFLYIGHENFFLSWEILVSLILNFSWRFLFFG